MPEDHEGQDDELRVRPFWSGTISFGLVSVPVNLFPGNRTQTISLRMLAPDGTPLARRYFCSQEDTALTPDEIVRGYELDGQYVVVTDEELEALEPEKSRDIDLRRFVQRSAIDPMFFERSYFLTPAGGSTKAYRLLAETMERTDRAGIATFVMRDKEYLVAILAENGILTAETLRFAEELRTPEDVGLPEKGTARKPEVARMEKAIRALSAETFDAAELEDTHSERLLELIVQKQADEKNVVHAPAEAADAEEDEDVIDLMELIRRNMRSAKRAGSAARAG